MACPQPAPRLCAARPPSHRQSCQTAARRHCRCQGGRQTPAHRHMGWNRSVCAGFEQSKCGIHVVRMQAVNHAPNQRRKTFQQRPPPHRAHMSACWGPQTYTHTCAPTSSSKSTRLMPASASIDATSTVVITWSTSRPARPSPDVAPPGRSASPCLRTHGISEQDRICGGGGGGG